MSNTQWESLSVQAVAVVGVVYFLALLAHLAEWAVLRKLPNEAPVDARTRTFGRFGFLLTVIGACVHLIGLVGRGMAADPNRVPWGNMYEFVLSGTFMVVLIFLLLRARFHLQWLAPVVVGFVLVILMVSQLTLYEEVVPLTEALSSPWLVIHVVSAVIATGAFSIGAMLSVLFLIKERSSERTTGFIGRMPAPEVLDRVAYRVHAFAFPVWTFAVLITGPIWAHYAWSRYWGWDAKEVWAFITWVVYAAYLHARATAGWKGRNAAIVALVGVATLWFNFIGINYFFGGSSQHSYAAPAVVSVQGPADASVPLSPGTR
ncbi:c-type cytochrome biogenesis protein CcsB [Nocardioides sp. JQ2195]|uniref:c-type cytochrome biogenesis protein CcsB n=1 Tax=Nocardioides sp. JQ2195 TaxID=2592334 RepID=UPI00143E40FE|nr:c-type cytochrome biogenesis protein CcsB [Nocardioides sp. JQ2195]QIX28144.1 c-type cytochrome biogenesis protein CcsB [Nocardioides sp. JQ2195]